MLGHPERDAKPFASARRFLSLVEEMDENRTTCTSMAKNAAADQGARQDSVIIVTLTIAIVAIVALGVESALGT